tara:strand:- start:2872 stop:3180 length:309 start_codon:yes stop_codon:yes gene_type:complete
MESKRMEYKQEFINSIIPKIGKKDFITCELHINAQELIDIFTKHKKHIESNNGFFSVSILKSLKDESKLYTKFTQLVEVKENSVSHKEQMPDRNTVESDLPF